MRNQMETPQEIGIAVVKIYSSWALCLVWTALFQKHGHKPWCISQRCFQFSAFQWFIILCLSASSVAALAEVSQTASSDFSSGTIPWGKAFLHWLQDTNSLWLSNRAGSWQGPSQTATASFATNDRPIPKHTVPSSGFSLFGPFWRGFLLPVSETSGHYWIKT